MVREGDILVSPESWEESKVLQFLPGFGFCHVEISICYMGEAEKERNKVTMKDRGLSLLQRETKFCLRSWKMEYSSARG